MKFRKLFGIAAFLLAAGIASGAVANVYTSMSGTANIDDPVFYAGSDNKLYLDDSFIGTSYKMNDAVPSENFETDGFDSANWYSFTVDMHAEARLENPGNGTMILEFGYIENGNRNTICEENVFVTSTSQEKHSASCSNSFSGTADKFYYNLTGTEGKTYWLNTYGDTRVEVNPE